MAVNKKVIKKEYVKDNILIFMPNIIISIFMTFMMKWCSKIPNGKPIIPPIKLNNSISLKIYKTIYIKNVIKPLLS